MISLAFTPSDFLRSKAGRQPPSSHQSSSSVPASRCQRRHIALSKRVTAGKRSRWSRFGSMDLSDTLGFCLASSSATTFSLSLVDSHVMPQGIVNLPQVLSVLALTHPDKMHIRRCGKSGQSFSVYILPRGLDAPRDLAKARVVQLCTCRGAAVSHGSIKAMASRIPVPHGGQQVLSGQHQQAPL